MTGEIVELNRNGVKSHCIVSPPDNRPPAFCIFEYVYFARPDSILEGKNGHKIIKKSKLN